MIPARTSPLPAVANHGGALAAILARPSGDSAREAGPGLIAEDLTEVLPAVFRRLYDEFGMEY